MADNDPAFGAELVTFIIMVSCLLLSGASACFGSIWYCAREVRARRLGGEPSNEGRFFQPEQENENVENEQASLMPEQQV